MKVTNKKWEKRMICLESQELRDENIIISDIKKNFRSAGFAFPNQVLAIEDKDTTTKSVN